MNAHHMMNSGAFGLSRLLIAQNHRSDVLSSFYDVWTYTWNYWNEMTGFSEKNSSETEIASGTYTHDSLDRRIGVDETSGGTTTQTWIVYNGNSNTPYAEFNGSGTLLERYLAGPSYVPGVIGMIARTNASGVTDWYLTGKLGSVRDIVNTSGTVIDHISYGAFGSIRAETNPSSGSQFKFDGMQYDTITGMYNDWHRGYSATSGRFLSLDPTGFNSGDSNLFRFVLNDSININDLNGYDGQFPAYPGINGQSPTSQTGINQNPGSYNPNYWASVGSGLGLPNGSGSGTTASNPGPIIGGGAGGAAGAAGAGGGAGAGAAPGAGGSGAAGGAGGRAGAGGGTGGGGGNWNFYLWMAQQGQIMAQQDQNELLLEARNDARLNMEYGTQVCDTAKEMIIHMIQSIMKKYRLYIHNGHKVGDLNLTIDITIHYPGLNGGRSPEFGSGNPGQEWGQGWVGQPVAPNNTPQFHPGPGGSILIVNPGPLPGLSPPDLLFS